MTDKEAADILYVISSNYGLLGWTAEREALRIAIQRLDPPTQPNQKQGDT